MPCTNPTAQHICTQRAVPPEQHQPQNKALKTACAHLRGVSHQRKAQRIGAALLNAVGEVCALAGSRLLHLLNGEGGKKGNTR